MLTALVHAIFWVQVVAVHDLCDINEQFINYLSAL